MIKTFKHKGLEKFYLEGTTAGIQSKHAGKLRLQLAALDTAKTIDDLDIPGYRLHPLKHKYLHKFLGKNGDSNAVVLSLKSIIKYDR